jgi:hypothetical protein
MVESSVELLSGRAYAARRGVSHTAVQKAIKSGRITTVGGQIDPAIADREWAENTDPSTSQNSVTGRPKGRRREGEPSTPNEIDGGGNGRAATGGTGYGRARAAREAALAGIAKLQLDEKTGKLVDANEVKLAFFNATRKARDELFAIPARIAPVLAALDDAADLEAILFDEIERVCKGLSDGNS